MPIVRRANPGWDKDMMMYRQEEQPINMSYLYFLRYLAEQDLLEHRPVGPSSGDYAPQTVVKGVIVAA